MGDSSIEASESSEESLSDIFGRGLKQYDELLAKKYTSTDAELESDVKKCIKLFEEATRLVSAAALFSSNETAEDLSTETLKFLLLPAFLGLLTLKLVTGSRKEIVGLAQIYLRDFIQRCKEYALTDIELPPIDNERKENGPADLRAQMVSREEKIRRLNKEKELNEKMSQLKEVLQNENVDESSKRDYFMTLIEFHLMKALEELNFIKAELPLIEMMEHAKNGKSGDAPKRPKPQAPPMQPFIITKNQTQKAVFGLGYPAMPIYTVDEFYEQRVKDGSFPGCQGNATTSAAANKTPAESIDPDEKRDQLSDEDDPVALERARNMDEFRDDHKRGEGNRYNRS